MATLVILRRYRDLPEALLAKSVLESAGIESILFDENTIRMNWFWSNALGGIKHCVDQTDAGDAAQLMSAEIPETIWVDGVGEFKQPRCLQCQSLNISLEDLNKLITYGSMLVLGFPIVVHRRRWKCQTCGYIWKSTDGDQMTGA